MCELLPEHLGAVIPDNQQKSSKPRCHAISNILEWLKCFGIYVAIISHKQPQRVPDLIGYQTLIIEAHMEYSGEGWMGYDRRFRQRAASDPNIIWSQIDTTLWNLAFSGLARAVRCKFCFSLTHNSKDCSWAPDPAVFISGGPSQQLVSPLPHFRPLRRRLCMLYNNEPAPGCSYPNCKFEHVCCLCVDDPNVGDKSHKALMCPYQSYHSTASREKMQRWRSPAAYKKTQHQQRFGGP